MTLRVITSTCMSSDKQIKMCVMDVFTDCALAYEHLCQRKEVESLYMLELSTIAATHCLQGWEIPAGIVVESTLFSSEVYT